MYVMNEQDLLEKWQLTSKKGFTIRHSERSDHFDLRCVQRLGSLLDKNQIISAIKNNLLFLFYTDVSGSQRHYMFKRKNKLFRIVTRDFGNGPVLVTIIPLSHERFHRAYREYRLSLTVT